MQLPRIVTLPFLIPFNAAAQVLLPGVIFVRRGYTLTVGTLAHELVHLDQVRSMGLLAYWWTYARLAVTHDQRCHPMELDAHARAPAFFAVAAAILGEDWEAA